MWTDIVDLRDFYASALGQVARRLIRRRLRQVWPDVAGQNMLGIGFAVPYLSSFRGEAARTIALMPAGQGVMQNDEELPGYSLLADETSLPLPDCSIDRLLIIHALESTDNPRALLREAWRVLTDSGRLLVIVPNRRGIWARMEATPFGNGRPYGAGQINRLLRDNLFTPMQVGSALFLPPLQSRMWLSGATAWEKIGEAWFSSFGGVRLVEAAKQIYCANPLREAARQRRGYLVMPSGAQPRAEFPSARAENSP
jgi:SAM-dependent methyltransferase